ncbi:hypothetical protein ACLOJK_004494 [Asimina triloba]
MVGDRDAGPDLVFAGSCEWSAGVGSGGFLPPVEEIDDRRREAACDEAGPGEEAINSEMDFPIGGGNVGLTALKEMATMDLADLNDFRWQLGFSNQQEQWRAFAEVADPVAREDLRTT